MKRMLSSLIAAALALMLLAGCATTTESTSPSESTTKATSATTATTQKEVKKNMYGWEIPETTIEIEFYQGDRASQEDQDKNLKPIYDYLLSEFNVKLRKIVYDVDATEKLNLMLAAGDYTKVICAMPLDTVSQWASQGKLYDMAPDITNTYPGIKTALGSLWGLYLDDEGKLFGLPRGWGLLPIPDNSAHIRWDWYLEMGSPKITTQDDYYNVIKQMVAAHPTNANGEKVYGISWNDQINFNVIMNGIWGFLDGFKSDDANNLTHWANTPEGLEAVQWYNRFYREGLLDPDAFINKFDDWKAKFSNERIVGHVGGWWQSWNAGHEVWQSQEGYTENKRYVQISFKDPDAKSANWSGKNTMGWNFTVITDKASAEERAQYLRFFEWAITPMATRIFGWGVPNLPDSGKGTPSIWTTDGTNWDFDPVMKEMIMAGKHGPGSGGGEIWLTHGQAFTTDEKPSTAWADQNFNTDTAPAAKWRKLMNDNMKGTIYDRTPLIVRYLPDNPLTITNQQIMDAIMPGLVKAIMSETEEECIDNFNELSNALNQLGLHDIEKFRTEQYKIRLEKMANN